MTARINARRQDAARAAVMAHRRRQILTALAEITVFVGFAVVVVFMGAAL